MLDWSRNPALEEELFARLRRKYIQNRSGEIHFSDTMYCLTKAYWEKTQPLPVDNATLGMFAIGFALEDVLLKPYPIEGKSQVDPYVYEEVHFSPDYFATIIGGEMDLKTTRMWSDPDGRPKSVADRPDGFPTSWLKQFMGYAHRFGLIPGEFIRMVCPEDNSHMLEPDNGQDWVTPRGCTECGTDAVELRGPDYVDYGVAILYLGSGELVAGTIRFDWQEVELNMAYHLHRAAILEDQLAQSIPPMPFVYNEAWECKNCRYFNRCKSTEGEA